MHAPAPSTKNIDFLYCIWPINPYKHGSVTDTDCPANTKTAPCANQQEKATCLVGHVVSKSHDALVTIFISPLENTRRLTSQIQRRAGGRRRERVAHGIIFMVPPSSSSTYHELRQHCVVTSTER